MQKSFSSYINTSFFVAAQTSSPTKNSLSAFTTLINEKYTSKFKSLNTLSKKDKIDRKFKQIKNSLEVKREKLQFDNLINNLDVIVNETRFLKERIELTEEYLTKGYLEKGAKQYFEIRIKGCFSPLTIKIDCQKGYIDAYASFINVYPSIDSCDKKFDSETMVLYSRHNVFIENKCYIGMYCNSNTRVSIVYTFKKPVENKITEKTGMNRHEKTNHFAKEIQKLREDPELRAEFEKRVKKILDKRHCNERLNFVNANKSLVSESLSYSSKIDLEVKIEEVKKRKIIITESKERLLKDKLMQRENREKAEEQAKMIQRVLSRKESFERQWLLLIYLIVRSTLLRTRFKNLKKDKIWLQIRRMKAYVIQYRFKKKFSKGLSFQSRMLLLSRDHLLRFNSCLTTYTKKSYSKNIINCIREIAMLNNVCKTFDRFDCIVRRIQYRFRRYMKRNVQRFLLLMAFWDSVIERMKPSKTKGKKKKHDAIAKLSAIPLSIKEKFLKEHFRNSKLEFINEFRAGRTPEQFKFMIEEEDLRSITLSLTMKKTKSTIRKSIVINESR